MSGSTKNTTTQKNVTNILKNIHLVHEAVEEFNNQAPSGFSLELDDLIKGRWIVSREGCDSHLLITEDGNFVYEEEGSSSGEGGFYDVSYEIDLDQLIAVRKLFRKIFSSSF